MSETGGTPVASDEEEDEEVDEPTRIALERLATLQQEQLEIQSRLSTSKGRRRTTIYVPKVEAAGGEPEPTPRTKEIHYITTLAPPAPTSIPSSPAFSMPSIDAPRPPSWDNPAMLPETFRRFHREILNLLDGPLHSVSDATKVAYVRMYIGGRGQDILDAELAPHLQIDPITVLATLQKVAEPVESAWKRRLELYNLRQREGESIETFILRIEMSANGGSWQTSRGDVSITALLNGIQDLKVKAKLVSKDPTEITWTEAKTLARRISAISSQTVDPKTSNLDVDTVWRKHRGGPRGKTRGSSSKPGQIDDSQRRPERQETPKTSVACDRCGRDNHTTKECRLPRDKTCYKCNKQGHLANVCRTKDEKTSHKTIDSVELDDPNDSEIDEDVIEGLKDKIVEDDVDRIYEKMKAYGYY